jgi:hypothetical protein
MFCARRSSREDIVNDCLKECFERDDNPETKTRRRDVLTIVNEWAKANHYPAFNGKKLANELRRLGIKGDDGDRFWFGIGPIDPSVLN